MAYKLSDIFEGDHPVSQYYGANVGYYSQFGFTNGHEGVDWATPTGVKVLAPFDGVIIRDVDDPKSGAYGTHLVVWDPVQKCAVWFCHLSENYVSPGQSFKRGDVLGKTGNTGNSTGPHLHVNFVETDASGNRLNTGNGQKGFLNILDSKLVEWQLGTQGTTPDPSTQIDDDHKRGYQVLEDYRKVRKDGPEGSFEGYTRQLVDRDSRFTSLSNDLAIANSEKDTLKNANTSLTENITVLVQENEELAKSEKILQDTVETLSKDNETLLQKLKECQEKPQEDSQQNVKLVSALQVAWDWFKETILKKIKP